MEETRTTPREDARIPAETLDDVVHAAPGAEPPARAGEPEVEAEGKYVYCIIRSAQERDFGPLGIGTGSSRVCTVHYGDLAAFSTDPAGSLADVLDVPLRAEGAEVAPATG